MLRCPKRKADTISAPTSMACPIFDRAWIEWSKTQLWSTVNLGHGAYGRVYRITSGPHAFAVKAFVDLEIMSQGVIAEVATYLLLRHSPDETQECTATMYAHGPPSDFKHIFVMPTKCSWILVLDVGAPLYHRERPTPALADRLKTIGGIRQCWGEAAQSVAAVHGAGLVHLDLKPANMVLHNKRIKVLDFGLTMRTHPRMPEYVQEVQTISFRAPEATHPGPLRIEKSLDVFGLGVVFATLLSGTSLLWNPQSPGELASTVLWSIGDTDPTSKLIDVVGFDEVEEHVVRYRTPPSFDRFKQFLRTRCNETDAVKILEDRDVGLLFKMMSVDPCARPTIEQVCEWLGARPPPPTLETFDIPSASRLAVLPTPEFVFEKSKITFDKYVAIVETSFKRVIEPQLKKIDRFVAIRSDKNYLQNPRTLVAASLVLLHRLMTIDSSLTVEDHAMYHRGALVMASCLYEDFPLPMNWIHADPSICAFVAEDLLKTLPSRYFGSTFYDLARVHTDGAFEWRRVVRVLTSPSILVKTQSELAALYSVAHPSVTAFRASDPKAFERAIVAVVDEYLPRYFATSTLAQHMAVAVCAKFGCDVWTPMKLTYAEFYAMIDRTCTALRAETTALEAFVSNELFSNEAATMHDCSFMTNRVGLAFMVERALANQFKDFKMFPLLLENELPIQVIGRVVSRVINRNMPAIRTVMDLFGVLRKHVTTPEGTVIKVLVGKDFVLPKTVEANLRERAGFSFVDEEDTSVRAKTKYIVFKRVASVSV